MQSIKSTQEAVAWGQEHREDKAAQDEVWRALLDSEAEVRRLFITEQWYKEHLKDTQQRIINEATRSQLLREAYNTAAYGEPTPSRLPKA